MSSFLQFIQTIDRAILSHIVSKRQMSLTFLMQTFSLIGDGYAWFIICLGIILAHPQHITILVHSVSAFTFEVGFYFLIKLLSARIRPCDIFPQITKLIIPTDKYSFPSGHTAAAFVMSFIVLTYIPEVFPIFLIFALGIGISRIYLGVHFPTDVIAGACLGIFSNWVGLTVVAHGLIGLH